MRESTASTPMGNITVSVVVYSHRTRGGPMCILERAIGIRGHTVVHQLCIVAPPPPRSAAVHTAHGTQHLAVRNGGPVGEIKGNGYWRPPG